MNRPDIKSRYFAWLVDMIDVRKGRPSIFEGFLFDLHQIEYYSIFPNDDNRCEDGVSIRRRFFENALVSEADEKELEGPCSFLEMLIGLADRIDFILYNPNIPDQGLHRWFWFLIKNLQLYKYTSDDNDKDAKRWTNKVIVHKFMERNYRSNGEGGLFPLRRPPSDQRTTEVWYQMMAWINENF